MKERNDDANNNENETSDLQSLDLSLFHFGENRTKQFILQNKTFEFEKCLGLQ